MDVRQIFSELSAHQIKGLMLHSSWADYFSFLGLEGFKRLHEYRYADESNNMRMIRRYFIEHYNELPIDLSIDSDIQRYVTWSEQNRFELNTNTREIHTRICLKGWVEWEKESKKLYENFYKTLSDNGEIGGSCIIEKLVCETDNELSYAENLLLNMDSVDFGMNVIILTQEKVKREADRKIKDFKLFIERGK